MSIIEKKRRPNHFTQWAAQFAVAGELCKRGYEVALTMGNHPSVDIMVRSPSNVEFSVDVKGLYRPNYWLMKKKASRINLFSVLAYVPVAEKNRFFVYDQATANAEIDADIARNRATAISKNRSPEKAGVMPGISWASASEYEGRWDLLPK